MRWFIGFGRRQPCAARRFKDMDENGGSVKADRRTKAESKVKAGCGDHGKRAA
jgi:hypothetical protein